MPSNSYNKWATTRTEALDEIENAHASIGGTSPGRRYATQQINHAYAVLVASQFQGFCRDLHGESVTHLVAFINPPALVRQVVEARFTEGRQLANKNAQPSSIGSDFGRLGIKFWDNVYKYNKNNESRKTKLEKLNEWRNAIAHQDFAAVSPNGEPKLSLVQVRRWRGISQRLAQSFDEVMRRYLRATTGKSPW